MLLHNRRRTGLYIVWCKVHLKKETHIFVYDSDFDNFQGFKYYGAIINNRKHSFLRKFEEAYTEDFDSIRNI